MLKKISQSRGNRLKEKGTGETKPIAKETKLVKKHLPKETKLIREYPQKIESIAEETEKIDREKLTKYKSTTQIVFHQTQYISSHTYATDISSHSTR